MSNELYQNEKERAVHHELIHAISLQCGLPEGKIEALYESELEKLKAGAKIMEYLPVLIRRRIMDALRDEESQVHHA